MARALMLALGLLLAAYLVVGLLIGASAKPLGTVIMIFVMGGAWAVVYVVRRLSGR